MLTDKHAISLADKVRRDINTPDPTQRRLFLATTFWTQPNQSETCTGPFSATRPDPPNFTHDPIRPPMTSKLLTPPDATS